MARETNLKWIQTMGGWASAKMLLDLYGHFLPTESTGYADALSVPRRLYPSPDSMGVRAQRKRLPVSRRGPDGMLAPRGGIEPPTRCLEGSCSIRLSYRGPRLG